MSSFAPGLRIHDRFTVERRIGAGGMSEVWRAYDTVLGRPVAVKVLSPAYAGHREATLHEARAVARIADPNIAAVHDYGELEVDGVRVPYLVMELVEGEDLAVHLQSGPLPWPRAAAITAQIAAGLAAAHRIGVVHRDVKPGNVMLTPTGVKLLDFGIAAAPFGNDSGQLIGTPSYAAPERLRPGPPTPASDVYAVGVLLYEMVTGAPPRRYADWAQAQAGWRRPSSIPAIPGLPPGLADLLAACLSTDPAQRPTAAQVARIAATAGAQTGAAPAFAAGTARPPTPPAGTAPPTMMDSYEPDRGRSLWPVAWLAAGVVLAIGIALVLVALNQPAGPSGSSSPTTAAASADVRPSPSEPAPATPAALVAEFERVLQDARDGGQISEDAAEQIGDRLDNLREHLDESDSRIAKRVRDVTKRIDELVKDDKLDRDLAEQLKQILGPIAED